MVRAHMLLLVMRGFNSEKLECTHSSCHFLYIIIYILPFLDIYRMPSLRHPQLPILIMCLCIRHHGQVKGKSKNMFRKSASFQDWAEFLMHHRP